jgi:hypothetical protein
MWKINSIENLKENKYYVGNPEKMFLLEKKVDEKLSSFIHTVTVSFMGAFVANSSIPFMYKESLICIINIHCYFSWSNQICNEVSDKGNTQPFVHMIFLAG